MNENWRKISTDEILNTLVPQVGDGEEEAARFGRIMKHRNNLALHEVSGNLKGLMETIYKASQNIDDSFQGFKVEQKRQDRFMLGLTIVIAIATILYTGITAWSVYTMQESNQIQAELLRLEQRKVSTEIRTH